ncbi:MAG: DUF6285 domain-containing protein [Candidatus Binatia bacterium]
MQDKPTPIELLEALAAFLREEVAPRLDGGLRFKALVGANVAGIVAREIAMGPAQDRAQLERLAALLGEDASKVASEDIAARVREWSQELCRRIDAGDADSGPWREQLLEHLRACVNEKLTVDNPRAAGR